MVKKITIALIIIAVAVPCLAAAPYEPGVVLVGVRHGYSPSALTSQYQTRSVISDDRVSILRINLLPGEDVSAKIRELSGLAEIAFVQPNYIYTLTAVPNDPSYSQQWYLNNTGQNGGKVGADIKAQSAWDISTGDTTIKIAVLDCGIDSTVGLTSYIAGFDFVDSNAVPNSSANHHGTRIAGIIGARGNDLAGLTGIMWRSTILDVRVFDEASVSTSETISLGIRFAVDTGARVLNLSFGNDAGTFDNTLASAIDYAIANNVVVVAAAGNGGGNAVDFPANYSSVIAVGATDRRDNRAIFSDIGSELDVVAPGEDIYSYKIGGTADEADGTSYAAPMVAAAAAMLLLQDPTLTPARINTILKMTADDIFPYGFDQYTGAGRLNLYRALKYLGTNITSSITSVNYPNPIDFRAHTYTMIESDAITGDALIKIYDLKGREVFTVPTDDIDGSQGKAIWRGVNFSAEQVSAGIYPYSIKSGKGMARGFVTVAK